MKQPEARYCISSVAATILELLGVKAPESFADKNSDVIDFARRYGSRADKAVIYNPDAVAWWIFEKYESKFSDAKGMSDLTTRLRSVMPSVTPVCFASMYSGVMPEIHGIQKYEKPVLKVDTVFDVLAAAGKKVAIVSTAGDSISKIFLERNIEYYILPTVSRVNHKAMQLIKKDCYDLIVIYNGNYDSCMHAKGPEGRKSLRALDRNLDFYCSMIDQIEKYCTGTTFYGFCPDHGCHLIDGNRGSHGLEMDEDMFVVHLYGINGVKK